MPVFNGDCVYRFEDGEWFVVSHCLNRKSCAHPDGRTRFPVPGSGLAFYLEGRQITLFPDRAKIHMSLVHEMKVGVRNTQGDIQGRPEGDFFVYEALQANSVEITIQCPEQP